MEWAVKEAVEHEELNEMDRLTMASLEEVEDDFWTVIKVAKTIPDDDYVMLEPLDTTTTYEEWLAVELAEMGIDMDMETSNTVEKGIELEDVVMGIAKRNDDIYITEEMGRPKTQESTVPGRLNFWDSYRGQVGGSYVCGEKDNNNRLNMADINITFKGTWYLKSWIMNHSVEYESDDLCTHPVQSTHNIWKSICAIYEGCHCLLNQTAAKRLYTYISCGAVPSLTGGYYNCAEGKISRKRKRGGKYTSFGPAKNSFAVGGGGRTSSSSVRKRLRGGRGEGRYPYGRRECSCQLQPKYCYCNPTKGCSKGRGR